ncbi:Structure-specific endonuclease subunit SLX1 [Cytospora mali]|uniref:Structure-specific endonuclease subunit SLX1 n=1 Tax=Cytospora mali TaxID=578113 RepID=A0A194ULN2_CYTMA|nr:Structure-specific endonuclease subunit SLX1 [Valsa mali var. pyri (nom. inval.)]
MAIQSKPIPALYVVYVLRSTVRKASLYIGSTPNPPRRLNQHNGKAKGGAVRTARNKLRPWEMAAVVSGFPSAIAALKFEWALNNAHLSLHISHEERLTVSTQRKRNGQPKRPPHTITSILSNLHLLLRVPSFSRWPLKLHLFDRDVFARWEKYCAASGVEPLRKTLEVVTDFKPLAVEEAEARKEGIAEASQKKKKKTTTTTKKEKQEAKLSEEAETTEEEEEKAGDEATGEPEWGVHALPLDYTPLAPYLEKGQDINSFEREGDCIVCQQQLEHDKGLYAICSNGECEGVGHLDCWSRHLLHQQGDSADEVILPMEGRCPKCSGVVRWGDMMRELTLRVRGQKEVEKILKKSRRANGISKAKPRQTKRPKPRPRSSMESNEIAFGDSPIE